MARREELAVKRILKAIKGTAGIKTVIAAKLGVSRWTIDKYEKKYSTVAKAIEEEREEMLDKAESVIHNQILAENEDTSKWFLARKGRERGYAEKTEQKIEGEIKTVIEVHYDEEIEDKIEDKVEIREG